MSANTIIDHETAELHYIHVFFHRDFHVAVQYFSSHEVSHCWQGRRMFLKISRLTTLAALELNDYPCGLRIDGIMLKVISSKLKFIVANSVIDTLSKYSYPSKFYRMASIK